MNYRSLLFIFSILISLNIQAQLHPVDVYAATSLQPGHPGEEAGNTIDGNNNTQYHSNWHQNGIPDQLDFYFMPSNQTIKQIVYTPRQSGANGIWTKIHVSYSTFDDIDNFIPIETDIEWAANNEDKIIDIPLALANVYKVRFDIEEAVQNFSSCAEMRFFSEEEYLATSTNCAISTTELSINNSNDTKAEIYAEGSYASSFQPGESIEKSFDGNTSTLYHSPWVQTEFPITLNYRLDGQTEIDYLKYTPRLDGSSNGWFGNVTILYNTLDDEEYIQLTEYDFAQLGTPEDVVFPTSITPFNVQIIVHNGANNYASCAEMEFYKSNPSLNPVAPSNIFADELFTTLLPNVTQTTISNISSTFYRELAQCIYDGTYQTQERVRTHEVFRPVQKISQELKVGSYNQFENPTGIAFEEGEKIVLFVRNLPATSVQLKLKDFEEGYYGDQSFYSLKTGLNVFEAAHNGLAYISYYNTNLDLEDIEIHIVSGTANGLFDARTQTNADWPTVLLMNDYPKVDIIGEYTHLVYDREPLLSHNPLQGWELVQKYDTIVKYQRMQMGLFKYNRSPKNRQFSYSGEGGGWFAGHLGIHLDITWGINNVVHPYKLDLWGIPHEFGHINQIRRDLNWVGTTEVTNNIYSVWQHWKMNPDGRKYGHLEATNVSPAEGMPSETGGRINGAIHATMIQENPLQGTPGYDVFEMLVPFWQLQLYYQAAGASKGAPILDFDVDGTHTDGIDYAHWYGTIAEYARLNSVNYTHGEHAINFVKYACDAVEEDLSDFFIKTGFLRPVDVTIDDYGLGDLYISQEMVDDALAYIASKNYAQPASPVINYISAHSLESYKNRSELEGVTGVGFSIEEDLLVIDNTEWKNAVAFETYDTEGELMKVSIVGTGDLSVATTKVYYPENAHKVYAVGYDGTKILVHPYVSAIPSQNKDDLNIYPNPVTGTSKLTLQLENSDEVYQLKVYDFNGRQVLKTNGKAEKLEESLNQAHPSWAKGTYSLNFKDKYGKELNWKLEKM